MRAESDDAVLSRPLSAELRTETEALHRATEAQLGLPGAIRTRGDYAAWLGRFYGLYQPLETRLAALTRDTILFPMLSARQQSPRLHADLLALQVDPGTRPLAPAFDLPSTASALGAHYVLEGSTLGGVLILQALQARLGQQIAGATQFFGGRGRSVGPMWQSFRAGLDAYGEEHPAQRHDVVAGAQRTFQALLTWCAEP